MKMRLLCLALLLAVSAGCDRPTDSAPPAGDTPQKQQAAPVPETKIDLKAVKYDELTEAIHEQLGKVVVVDIWASWCGPCKKEFPHLVELHQKYAKDGLVAMSVSVDDEGAPHDAALKFLQKVKATFRNYRIDEPKSVYQEKWDFNGVPAVFVFDRQGRRAGKFTNDDPDKPFTYSKDVVPLVEKLLKAQ
jgi:thiol-disulfide isomerase/thioredoxin